MNAVSQLLRVIAILGALTAGGLYYLDLTEVKKDKEAASAEVTKANAATAAAKTEADTAKKDADAAADEAKDATAKLTQAQADLKTAQAAATTQKTEVTQLTTKLDAATKKSASYDSLQQNFALLEDKYNQLLKNSNKPAGTTTTDTPGPVTPGQPAGNGQIAGGPATPTGPTTGPVTPTKVLDIDPKAGLLVLAVGTNGGVEKNSVLTLQSDGVKLLQVRITNSQPNYAVGSITSSTISVQQVTKLIKPNTALDFVQTR